MDVTRNQSIVDALTLMQNVITAMQTHNAFPSAGVTTQRNTSWRGVIMTFTLEAAYDTLT